MHVRSFLPIAGLTLLPCVFAASLPAREIFKRDNLTISSNLPFRWYYRGCYSDSVSNRALSSASYTDNTGMTEETCIAFCESKGYGIAGVEYSAECFCGYQLGSAATQQSESDCNKACTGNAQERCGGSSRLNVFSTGDPPPQTNPGTNGYKSIGCYTDSVSARTLNTSVQIPEGSNGMSVQRCTAVCSNRGFTLAGVEYARECFCGNAIQNGGAPASDGCTMICTGQTTEFCGGSSRLNLYQATGPIEQLRNPSFESGGSSWSVNPSAAGSNGLSGSFSSDTTNAHTGKGYFFVSGSQSSGASGQRGICISQELYIEKTGSYTLSFYTGGVDKFVKDPRSSIPPQYSLTFSAALAGSSYSGSVCKGNCPVNNVGGSPAYNFNTYTLNIPKDYQTLTICANYDGTRRGQDDYFFLDDVSLVGPN